MNIFQFCTCNLRCWPLTSSIAHKSIVQTFFSRIKSVKQLSIFTLSYETDTYLNTNGLYDDVVKGFQSHNHN